MIRLDDLADLLRARGNEYYGEDVTLLQHSLQTADLAEGAGLDDHLVVAALFHDIGHALEREVGVREDDVRHEVHGERLLEGLFGPSVARPVGLHVVAKRFQCTRVPSYVESLSSESRRSLERQGGPLTLDECAAIQADPYFSSALTLRRLDDAAKSPHARPRDLQYFLDVARRVIERN